MAQFAKRSSKRSRKSRIDEAREILIALGLPSRQTNERSARTLMALAQVAQRTNWSDARSTPLRTVDIMAFIAEHCGIKYAANTRETIRRQTLRQFVQARVADLNPDDPTRSTNSGNNCYALTNAALVVVRSYGTLRFEAAATAFISEQGSLQDLYRQRRTMNLVDVTLPDGRSVSLSPGPHNQLQRQIVEQFGPRFAPGAVLLYLGDTAKKHVVLAEAELRRLSIPITEHDTLPDIVLYRPDRHWLYLVEAVTSHGPISPTRKQTLEELVSRSNTKPIYVSAFPTRGEFRRYVADVAWETEVWIAEDPDHLIHFNGDRFLGPHA